MTVDIRREPRGDSAIAVQPPTPSFNRDEIDGAIRRRSRTVWLVLWFAFFLFSTVLVGAIYGAGSYRNQSLSSRTAMIEIISGTVLHQTEDAVRETVATNSMRLLEGDRVRTSSDAQALITFHDGSIIRLWPDTSFELRQVRTSTYTNNQTVIILAQRSGHTRIEVSPPTTQERRFEIQTPHGRNLLREGSYRLEIGSQGTDLAVRTGSASVTAHDQTVEVLRGERTTVLANGRPSSPSPVTRNILRNGDFSRGLVEGWQWGSRNEEDSISGQVSLVEQDGRSTVRLRRQDSERHGETFIRQSINRDVTDDSTLRLILDTKVVSQTLSGGGWRGSEYPLLVRVRYRDAYGSENSVIRGFYVKNPDGHPTTNGVQVQANQWLPVVIDLFNDREVIPRPAYLLWVEIEAAGWDFESFITGIQLLTD